MKIPGRSLCSLLFLLALSGLLAGELGAQETDEETLERVKKDMAERPQSPIFDQVVDILERTTGEGCLCPNPFKSEADVGVIWRGDEPIDLHRIATLAAPTMWFSLDEPLILSGDGPLPNAHPCDQQGNKNGVVYYAPYVLRLDDADRPVTNPAQDDPEFFEKVHSYSIRYYFYYVRDQGVGEHAHDIELAEFFLVNERTADGCYQVRITKVVALAHGVDWYNNIMEVRRDTRYPIAIFVEEGKHASCPDRNSDGVYTPGYDVTSRPNDAWGVRDVLGQGVLQGAAFKAAMSKKRDPVMRRLPPDDPERCPSLPTRATASTEYLGHYDLRPANTIEMCEGVEHPEFLEEMMNRHGFGKGQVPTQFEENSLKELTTKVENPASIIPSISLRWDQDLGFSFLLNGLDMGEFWLVPKFNLAERAFGMEILITASASRWADGYITLGSDRFPSEKDTIDGEEVTVRDAKWDFATEVGYKFRFLAPSNVRPFLLGYHFGGLRLGTRWSGFDNLRNPRFVVELGAGVW